LKPPIGLALEGICPALNTSNYFRPDFGHFRLNSKGRKSLLEKYWEDTQFFPQVFRKNAD
jgi:hypothetical protein